jgi:hypothetical protein
MYFQICNHYFDEEEPLVECSVNDTLQDNEHNEHNEYSECLICLEIKDKNDFICIKIQNIFYSKNCLCDGWIHHYCLDFWYTQNKGCPICLCKMSKNEIIDKVITHNNEIAITNVTPTFCLSVKYLLVMFIFFNILFLLHEVMQCIIFSNK